ncbi:TPA_asm: hypothetical protein G0D46_23420 [Salmonella enterica subsp. enterica serovar Java]|nr:hypothetical protein [Salmonella enterica subsp. enterica]EAY8713675.1 hypothetical protein [Salmonella enterica]ECI2267369.1 hypothetical protein [Salmonella enterica subsp. enterica serovar Wandsworth]EGZ3914672.1 hypothetical protein [Salmonella enterica subsp. enterica serovar Java]EBH6783856.1 hypothetical protein [Salmonella enterica]
MKNIKIISIFKINEKVPFITCVATDMEQSKDGIKLTLESGESICIKDFMSEADDDMDREQMINSYRRLFSEFSGISKVTVNSLMP